LTSALDGVRGQFYTPATLHPGNQSPVPRVGPPRAGLDDVKSKILPLSRIEPRLSNP
jgi:hypothetical protein